MFWRGVSAFLKFVLQILIEERGLISVMYFCMGVLMCHCEVSIWFICGKNANLSGPKSPGIGEGTYHVINGHLFGKMTLTWTLAFSNFNVLQSKVKLGSSRLTHAN